MTTRRNNLWRRRSAVLALASLLAASIACLTAGPAAAAASVSFSAGTIMITGTDGDDNVAIDCSGGNLTLNGGAFPGGPVPCSSVTDLQATLKDGTDILTLFTAPASFPALTSGSISGGTGNDIVFDRAGAMTFNGGDGNDGFTVGEGNDTFDGGNGADAITTHPSSTNAVLTDASLSSSSLGNDTIASVERATLLINGSGDASGFSGAANLIGDTAPDTLIGGSGPDRFEGRGGVDTIQGGSGNDFLDPGDGVGNALSGGSGSDTVYRFGTGSATLTDSLLTTSVGGSANLSSIEKADLLAASLTPVTMDASSFSGSVSLRAGSDSDTLTGGPLADRLNPSGGDDSVDGAGGIDTFISTVGTNDSATLTDTSSSSSNDGSDTLESIERAEIVAGNGDESIDARLFTGSTRLDALKGNDELLGGTDKDTLIGGSGSDMLKGFAGNDVLNGGPGTDTCNGGPGNNKLKGC